MTRGRAAKDLASAICAAADDDDVKLKQWFKEVELKWTDFEGAAFNRVFRAITGKPAEKIQKLVAVASQENKDYRPILEQLLAQFLNLPGYVVSVESPFVVEGDSVKGDTPVDQLEKIIGQQSTLLPISFLEEGLQRARAVARIVVTEGNSKATGTGFLVEGNWLVTNHHVLPNATAAKDSVAEFNYEQTIKGRDRQIEPIAIRPNMGFKTSEQHDWTVVKLEGNPNDKYGQIPLAAATVAKQERVIIIQHPGGGPKQIGLMHNLVTYADDRIVQYLTDTLPGSSGAPVFNEAWELVALHHSGGWLREPGTKQKLWRNEGIVTGQVLSGAGDVLGMR